MLYFYRSIEKESVSKESWYPSGSIPSIDIITGISGTLTLQGGSSTVLRSYGGDISLSAGGSSGTIKITDTLTNHAYKNLADYPVNWSAINNKPSISIDSAAEVWKPTNKNISITSNVVNIGGTTSSKIFVLDSTTKTKTLLEDYPTAWKKVSNKPRAMELFGYVFVKASTSSDPDEYWPAVAVKDSYNHSDFDVYKFNGSGWVRGKASEFIAFTDTDPN